MQISKSTIRCLQNLANGESIAASSLRKDIVDDLMDEGLLTVSTHGSRRSFSAIDTKTLRIYLASKYEVLRDLDNSQWIFENDTTRADQASLTGNSKLVPVRACPGFPINSYEPIQCNLLGSKFVVNPQEGSFVFVVDWKQFVIPEDIAIVGIENMENFRMIRKQREFFEQIIPKKRILFVSRYPQSTDLRMWLQSIKNIYYHFGDFDLAGINIFLTEFYKFIGEKASFIIPPDIEERLAHGSLTRYNEQYPRFHNLKSDISSVQNLLNLINRYHRCYDQEGLITDWQLKSE